MDTTNIISTEKKISAFKFFFSELKPRENVWTPFNVISGLIILVGIALVILRFIKGVGVISEGSQQYPWGVLITFNVITGVAFAAGGYVLTFIVYVLGNKKYEPIMRTTVLWSFLSYVLYFIGCLLDIGRPWNIVNPIIGNGFGVSSILFLVAWHFLLYMGAAFLEVSPAFAEWLDRKNTRKFLQGLTLGAVIFGITLSMLHQSGLGALFLFAPNKIHPLWYTEFIPILFLVSSIFAGVSIVIIESSISQKFFKNLIAPKIRSSYKDIVVGLGKIAIGSIFVYLALKILMLIHGKQWALLGTSWGIWYLVEVIGFVLIPLLIFIQGVKNRNLKTIRWGAVLVIIGIILNRLNVGIIAYNWNLSGVFIPIWKEIIIALTIILIQIWIFRWIITRMPILNEKPKYKWIQE